MGQERDWVEEELRELELGDKRLNKRAIKIVQEMSAKPTGSIPEFSSDLKAARGAYNFFSNKQVQVAEIIAAQREGTLKRIKEGEYPIILALQDTTEFTYNTHQATEGLGPLDNAQVKGFFVHNTLATTVAGVPLGLLAQEVWVRDEAEVGKSEQRHQLPIEEKESYKWLKGLSESTQQLPQGVRVVEVSDRESDIYEYFVHPRPQGVDLLVRAKHDRRLEGEPLKLRGKLRSSPVRGKIEVKVAKTEKYPPRTATCQVSFKKVTLRPPKQKPGLPDDLKPISLWAILVREMSPPEGQEGLEWLLLTTLPVDDFDGACQIIDYYTKRWLVERFHFVLKSGCALEDRQLRRFERLHRFLALANIVSWRLLWLTYLGRDQPDLPCTVALADFEWQALYAFAHKTPLLPDQPPSLGQATRWIAQLGGFLARKSDGYPGVKVLWRGWQRLVDLVQMRLIFQPPLLT